MTQEEQQFNYGVEITLEDPDKFLILKESLTRLGLKSKNSKVLYQSVHILHKRGRYFLLHFKEFFALDGKDTDFSDDDYRRRNTIARLVSEWGLCKIVNMSNIEVQVPVSEIAIIPFKDKKNYQLVSKYTVGGRK